MSRSTILIRPLVAAAAIVALAAPAAFAAPIDVQSPGHPSQHIRSAHPKDSAAQPESIKDLRSPDAQDAATRTGPAGTSSDNAVYWSYDYQAPDPKTAAALAQERAYASSVKAPDPKNAAALAQERAYSSFVKAQPVPAATTDDDTPWAIIGLGITGAVLALLAATTLVLKTRVRRAQRVTV
jgi:hypothetical protein